MGDKPSYLGLLNAVAQGEWRAHQYLNDWIAITDDPEVQAVLRTVTTREGEHAMAFTKRLDELGFAIKPREPDAFEIRSADIARSDRSDLEKLDALGYGTAREPGAPDDFDGFFRDHTIDPTTGALLGRYLCEERDSERRLQALHASLAARTPAKPARGKRATTSKAAVAR
jgi:rubrerythrin